MKTFSSTNSNQAKKTFEALKPLLFTAEDVRQHVHVAVWNRRLHPEYDWVKINLQWVDECVVCAVEKIVQRCREIGQTSLTYSLSDVVEGSSLSEFPSGDISVLDAVKRIGEDLRVMSEDAVKISIEIRGRGDVVTARAVEDIAISVEGTAHRLYELASGKWLEEMSESEESDKED